VVEFPTKKSFTSLAADEIGGESWRCFTLPKLMRQLFDVMSL
jgi:hypothetical protein